MCRGGYGWADAKHHVRNTIRTRFAVASVTKEFTAAGILLLQDRGKLSVSDPVCKYLTGCPATGDWPMVTIHMLLTHTAGLSITCGITNQAQYFPLATMVQTCLKQPFQAPPGTQWIYSDGGYAILGYVIQKLSGMSYPDFMARTIFRPLGMRNSGIARPGRPLPHVAVRYYAWKKPLPPFSIAAQVSFGGMYSTVGDLLRWDRAMDGHRLLSARSYKEMFTPWAKIGTYCGYGYGWLIQQQGSYPLTWHNGLLPGVATYNGRYPRRKAEVILLSNLGTTNLESAGALLVTEVGLDMGYWLMTHNTNASAPSCDTPPPH